MPKLSKEFRNKYKITSAVMIASILLSSPIGVNANEIEGNETDQVVEVSQTIVEEVVQEEVVQEEVVQEEVVQEEVVQEEVVQEEVVQEEVVQEEVVQEEVVQEEVVESKDEKQTEEVSNGLSDQDIEQLGYAIEEMRIVVGLIDNSDLTDKNNFERLSRFSQAAAQRLKLIDANSANESEKKHIEWLKNALEESRLVKGSVSRLIHAMDNVNTVFDAERRDTLKNKQVVLDILGTIANQERLNVNTYTSYSAYTMYHDFYAVWEDELDKAVTQLGYAIEEVREAVNCKDNKDLTVTENLDRMKAFAKAATDRLEGLYVLEGLENYSQHMENLRTHLKVVNKTIDLATQIRNAMDKVIDAFDKGLTREEKIEALDELGTLVDENKYDINTYTSYTAMKLYHDYYAILDKVGDGSGEDDMQVTPEEEFPAVGDGSGEDDMQVTPEEEFPAVGDGSGEDNMQVTPEEEFPAVGDGSGEDNMMVDKEDTDKKTPGNSKNPQTGDVSILGYATLGLSSLIGLAATRRRK